MSDEVRAQPLDTTIYGGNIMQPDEEIQYAPRSRPVSFYDNFKVNPRAVSRVIVYVRILSVRNSLYTHARTIYILGTITQMNIQIDIFIPIFVIHF